MATYDGPGVVGARITDDQGITRDIPEDLARQEYPELFQGPDPGTSYASQGAGGAGANNAYDIGQEMIARGEPLSPDQANAMNRAYWQQQGEDLSQFGLAQQGDQLMAPEWQSALLPGPASALNAEQAHRAKWALAGGDTPVPPEYQIEIGKGTVEPLGQTPQGGMAPGSVATQQGGGQSGSYARQHMVDIGPLGIVKPALNGEDFAQERADEQVGAMKRMQAQEQAIAAEKLHEKNLMENIDRQVAFEEETGRQQDEQFAIQQGAKYRAEMEVQQAWQDIPRMDPSRLWSNMETGAKVTGLAAAAIQGFLDPGGKNHAVEGIFRQVDADMAAQRQDIETAAKQAAAQERTYGRLVDAQALEREMLLKSRYYKLQRIAGDMQKNAAQYESSINRAKAQDAIGQVVQESAKAQALWKQQIEQNHITRVNSRNQAVLGEASIRHQKVMERQGWANYGLQKKRLAMEEAANRQKAMEAALGTHLFTTPDGKRVYAPPGVGVSEKQQDEIKDAVTMQTSLSEYAKQLKELTIKQRRTTNPDERLKYAAQQSKIVEAMRSLVGANLPDSEAERALARFGSAGSWLNSPEANIELIDQAVTDAGRSLMRKVVPFEAGIVQFDERTGQMTRERLGYDASPAFGTEFKPMSQQDVEGKVFKEYLSDMTEPIKQYKEAKNPEEKQRIAEQIGIKFNNMLGSMGSLGVYPSTKNELFNQLVDAAKSIPPEALPPSFMGQMAAEVGMTPSQLVEFIGNNSKARADMYEYAIARGLDPSKYTPEAVQGKINQQAVRGALPGPTSMAVDLYDYAREKTRK